jgi:Flp pilus assembly protein TadG
MLTKTRVTPLARAKKLLGVLGEERAQSLVEFALVFPILIILVMGIVTFGIAFGTYQTLTNAAAAGAQALSISRGNTLNPCTLVSAVVFNTSPYLVQNNIKFTITTFPSGTTTGGTVIAGPNTANPSCVAPTNTTGSNTTIVPPNVAQVTLTYPCKLSIFGINYAPGCTLTAQTSEAIQ